MWASSANEEYANTMPIVNGQNRGLRSSAALRVVALKFVGGLPRLNTITAGLVLLTNLGTKWVQHR